MTDRPAQPISVLCVDDNRIVADAVAAKLRLARGFEWCGHLASADDLVAVALRRRPSIILLDVDMAGADPFDAARELTECCSESRVIFFSGHVRAELLERAIAVGAWGYIAKSDGEQAMLDAILEVAEGGFAMSAEVRSVCERG